MNTIKSPENDLCYRFYSKANVPGTRLKEPIALDLTPYYDKLFEFFFLSKRI